MSECTHDCSNCSSDCASRESESLIAKTHPMNKIKRVIGVVSGKGGVGKSLVTGMLAVAMRRRGYETAIIDADITGPSIPKEFGLKDKAQGGDDYLLPVRTSTGIAVMSVNLLLPDENDPVVWRGPIIAGTVKQFWTDVIYGDVDYMFVDMPPGTGDVPLTVFQSLPLDGIIIVTSPQELVSMIVNKAVKMAKLMNIPILGLIENYSYAVCPHCNEHMKVFGESHIDSIAGKFGLKVLAKLPINPAIAESVDNGKVEELDLTALDGAGELLEKLPSKI